MSYETIAEEIDKNREKFIDRLREAVEIPSVSAQTEHRDDIFRMIDWTQKQMEVLGINCQKIENGVQPLENGQILSLPPVLFGTLGEDESKKTLLVYGHLDVQPAKLEDGWNTDPFKLVEKGGKLYGRGSTDDKGPILAWLHAIETMQHLKIDIPVNIKFVFEGMEEVGSIGLRNILEQHQDTFLRYVDMVCISDDYWLGKDKPCITGLCYYAVEISEAKQDLHSGVFGGTIHEPMNDLVWILSHLQDLKGKILIDGIYDLVAPITPEEEQLYETIDFDLVRMF
uniref:Cytosolic non-specific dipeptidase n=1 Tax=Acrobeloides nanus TaxID=290746 RepID=A0A914CJK0_9BILA